MKKIYLLLLFISLLVVIPGCKANYVMGEGSLVHESETYNQYTFTSFRGRYVFHKVATAESYFKVTTYVEEGSINISMKSGNDFIFKDTASLDASGTKTYYAPAGDYYFILSSSAFKGYVNFVWDVDGNDSSN